MTKLYSHFSQILQRHLKQLCLKTSNRHIRLSCKPFGRSTQRNRGYEYFSGLVHRLIFHCVWGSDALLLYLGSKTLLARSPDHILTSDCVAELWTWATS
jgi:hypothetical protein